MTVRQANIERNERRLASAIINQAAWQYVTGAGHEETYECCRDFLVSDWGWCLIESLGRVPEDSEPYFRNLRREFWQILHERDGPRMMRWMGKHFPSHLRLAKFLSASFGLRRPWVALVEVQWRCGISSHYIANACRNGLIPSATQVEFKSVSAWWIFREPDYWRWFESWKRAKATAALEAYIKKAKKRRKG